ncbi:MAG: 4'-phosphopantetheinyl transferase superfamily protein [Bacteroidales bacterium]|nr:MAG: 4'-phosphopantetheinyl transferase superfamily protein [Bacteroidales bacterium]
MGLLLKKYVKDDCLLGIWEVTEDYDDLYSKLSLLPEEMKTLNGFQNPLRGIEWLSVRVLLNEITGENLSVIYNSNRKPFIKGNSYNVSIAHSKDFTTVLLSKDRKVGIDLEFMSHRISNIESKFINDDEVITQNKDRKKYHLYIHWCAKEALYKICDKQDINFRKNLTIEPFEPEEQGNINGWVNNKYMNEKFQLYYFTINNYIIVWTVS